MYVQACVHAFTTSFSFLLRRSGTAPLGISTASLILSYVMEFCRVSAEHAGNATVGTEDLAKQAGTSQPAGGCMGCRVWELQSFATSVAVLLPLSWERGAEGLFASSERHYTRLKNVCCYCEVTNFSEPKETERTFRKTWGFGSSPFLPQNSQPALFDMRSYWYSYSCRTMTFYVADRITVNVYYILVYSHVCHLP